MSFAVSAVVDERIKCFRKTICIVDIHESDTVSSNLADGTDVACNQGETSALSLKNGESKALVERGICHYSSIGEEPRLGICVDWAERMNPLLAAGWEALDCVMKASCVVTIGPGDDE